MLLDAIDHVQLAMPQGGEELAEWFYSEVLGVPRVPKPPELALRGGCWFERGSLRIHLGVDPSFVPAGKAHPAFAVSDLDRLERQLGDVGLPIERVDGHDGPQLYVSDPFGNRLEFRPPRPIAETSSYAPTVVEVARRCVGDRFADQLRFVIELDRLKTVDRQSFILEAHRRENSAEHSWQVATMAAVLAEYGPPGVDVDHVARMLSFHDIVEIDAGDTGIYDDVEAGHKEARERAAADRIFGLLPPDQAADARALWDEYESGTSAEARLARLCDRLAPFLANLCSRGVAWRRHGVTADRVSGVLAPIGEVSSELGAFVEAMLEQAVADRLLPAGGSGLLLPGSVDFHELGVAAADEAHGPHGAGAPGSD